MAYLIITVNTDPCHCPKFGHATNLKITTYLFKLFHQLVILAWIVRNNERSAIYTGHNKVKKQIIKRLVTVNIKKK